MEYNGFLYDTSQGISLKSSAILEKPNKATKDFVRRPFVGIFKVAGHVSALLYIQLVENLMCTSMYCIVNFKSKSFKIITEFKKNKNITGFDSICLMES